MENKLTEINQRDLPLLQSLYNPNEPDGYIAYTTIDTYIRWFEQNPSLNHDKIKFYSLNGDFSHGTFIVTVSYMEKIKSYLKKKNYVKFIVYYHCTKLPDRIKLFSYQNYCAILG